MFCPFCGKSNPAGATYCNGCGKQLPEFLTTVTCPYCGAGGQEYQINCTKCGKELPRGRKIEPFAGAAAPASAATTRVCSQCGRPMSIYDVECAYCRQPVVDRTYDDHYEYDSYHRESESDLPVIGGVLILIAGVLGIIHGLLTLGALASINTYGLAGSGYLTCCALLMCLFGLVAIFGGYSGLNRDSLAFAIVGGILGILSIGFFIGALLSLIGIVLVAVGHREFSS